MADGLGSRGYSKWGYIRLVTCGAPQGFIPGLVLSNVFKNGLHAGLDCILRKFADDTKVGGAADSLEAGE